MNRNALLLRRSKKAQKEDLERLREETAKKAEFKRLNDPDPNKYNPDIPTKYQDNKNKRSTIIKPSNFKIDDSQIKDTPKDDLNKLLRNRLKREMRKYQFQNIL